MSGLWLWSLPAVPALAGLVLLVLRHRAGPAAGPAAALVAGLTLALAVALQLRRGTSELAWIPAGDRAVLLSLSGEGAAALLAVLVAAVSLLVFLFALADIGREEARGRFFGFMTLFCGAMELVVLADDLLTMLIGFELVGLCSWALIGFWHGEAGRARAGLRAFATTRGTDLGLYVAAFAALAGAGETSFRALAALPPELAAITGWGIVLAALGKSAQLPFSGWLSGAMLGPSPVSALLHSATMVAAGAILLVKAGPLLDILPDQRTALLAIGVATALAAGLIALRQRDLKQVLAASTVSQFGYVFAALGAAGTAAALTHLFNHAAFKAALFILAGLLLHRGMRRLNEMGGLRRAMPWSAAAFAVCLLALAALPPLGGFFSKEALLASVKETSHAAFWLLLLAGGVTAAYAMRVWLGTFAGEAKSAAARTAREGPRLVLIPAGLLALAALAGGLLVLPGVETAWTRSLGTERLPPFSPPDAVLATAVALAGAAAAWLAGRRQISVRLGGENWFGLVALLDKAGRVALAAGRALDRLDRLEPAERFAGLARRCARAVAGLDAGVIAPLSLERSAAGAKGAGMLTLAADRRLLDAMLARMSGLLQAIAGGLSRVQSGLLHRYCAAMAGGIAALLVAAFAIYGR